MSSIIGIVITIIYIAFVFWLRPDILNIGAIQKLTPNGFGDLFTWVFGPLMLFWVVLGYFKQRKELKRSSEALELQAQELNETLQQHKEIVDMNKGSVHNTFKK